MLSINTNLSSLIAQNSLKNSTSILNQAVERMTTGYKINHASDNAANYSISTNMQTQINSYDVAADNVAMGMDLVTTAMDIVSNMQSKASRLRSLSTQARNGTYGAQSMAAINTEAAAIMAEINRLYSTAEYNDISLFNRKAYEISDHLPKAGTSGFIDETALISMTAAGDGAGIAEGEVVGTTTEAPKAKYNGFIENPKTYTDAEVAAMTRVKDVSTFTSGKKYAIYTVEELQKLADYVNSGENTSGVEFVLGADIDLSSSSNWTPIGDYSTNTSYRFVGTFDGNGHIIKNITIDKDDKNYQGLFGYITNGSKIKNVVLEDINIKGKDYVGGITGYCNYTSSISNCYATGTVIGQSNVGAFVGETMHGSKISSSYTRINVVGTDYVGGLAGYADTSSTITNSYATGTVSGTSNVGGLVGCASSSITNSYATGTVSGTSNVGGLAGSSYSSITNSYATGTVSGTSYVGGLAGSSYSSITNSYSTGNVTGTEDSVGGLVGYSSFSISNSYATGTVGGTSNVGGLAGNSFGTITNSYATGTVGGTSNVGGLAGDSSGTITNSYATGNVTGSSDYVGGLAGSSYSSITNSYSTGNVTGSSEYVGGLVGRSDSIVSNSYATGTVRGTSSTGGLAGSSSTITNSYATGNVYADGTLSRPGLGVGGLVGSANSDITNSYATGNVTSNIINDDNYEFGVGGLVGYTNAIAIEKSYTTGTVSAQSNVGGLIGYLDAPGSTLNLTDCASYSDVRGGDINSTGSFIGSFKISAYYMGGAEASLTLTNSQVISSDNNIIGGCYSIESTGVELISNYDFTSLLADINQIEKKNIITNLLVGINGDSSSQIAFDTNFAYNISAIANDISSDSALVAIDDFISQLSEQETKLGAVQNRLESALESISVNIENLTSSLSTIRDADISEVSSDYIRQQILQQASATLMSTANQSPSIALQLI